MAAERASFEAAELAGLARAHGARRVVREGVMSDEPRVVATPGVCGGEPRLDETRLTVETIVGAWRWLGEDLGAMAREYVLTPAQVRAALDYYAAYRPELDLSWALDEIESDEVRAVVAAAVDWREAQRGADDGYDTVLAAAVDAWRRATGQEG